MSDVPGADAREPGAQAWAGEREAGPCSLPVLVDGAWSEREAWDPGSGPSSVAGLPCDPRAVTCLLCAGHPHRGGVPCEGR